jgi:hypothetical protein
MRTKNGRLGGVLPLPRQENRIATKKSSTGAFFLRPPHEGRACLVAAAPQFMSAAEASVHENSPFVFMRFAEMYDKSVNLNFALLFFAGKNDKMNRRVIKGIRE